MGLQIYQEQIKQKKTPDAVKLYLIRGNNVLPLNLPKDRYGAFRAEYYQKVEEKKSRPTYEQLELMFVEAEARRLHAEFSYRLLERQGMKSKAWDELS